MKTIDINCDMGESYGNYQIGNDRAVFPYIASSNIACGFHGGDPLHMEHTVKAAIEHGVKVGAHPGFPDLAGFGRRKMELPSHELKAIIKYQLSAIKGVAESLGTSVGYVKPHGALYNMAANDEMIAKTLVSAIREIDDGMMIMGLSGSLFQEICHAANIPFVAEAFADRRYERSGNLRSRGLEGAVLSDPEVAANQVMDIVQNQYVIAHDGAKVAIEAQSICIHGDNVAVGEILKAIDKSLINAGVKKKSFL